MGAIRQACNELLIYMMYRVHLSMADKKFILAWFNKIFGKKKAKPTPQPPLPPKLTEFTVGQDLKWRNFLAAANLLDKDRAI